MNITATWALAEVAVPSTAFVLSFLLPVQLPDDESTGGTLGVMVLVGPFRLVDPIFEQRQPEDVQWSSWSVIRAIVGFFDLGILILSEHGTIVASKTSSIVPAISILVWTQIVVEVFMAGKTYNLMVHSVFLVILSIIGVAATVVYFYRSALQRQHMPPDRLILIMIVYRLTEILGQCFFLHSPWKVKRWLENRRLENMVSTQNDISEAVPRPSAVTLSALTENVSHWSGRTRHSQKQKLLWIATDRKENNGLIADAVFKLLIELGFGPLQIDVECQRTVLMPLIDSLEQLPSYRAELNSRRRLDSRQRLLKSTQHLLVEPLHRIQAKFQSFDCEADNQTTKCTTLIINGARVEQATELRTIIGAFKDFPQSWNIIVIGQPDLLNDGGLMPHHDVSILYLCDNGLNMYSGKNPAAPASLYKVDAPATVTFH
ncbi:hypothetical protein K438DRAFT_1791467 [Mycena galopus ATCC 62051]|nr:hypothetical protein K438DRAFT_1791467 [Mycena galopus ATCC 62051]